MIFKVIKYNYQTILYKQSFVKVFFFIPNKYLTAKNFIRKLVKISTIYSFDNLTKILLF